MVGLVVVSHSEQLADGVVALAREMAGPELAIEPAGGIEGDDPEHPVLGTDAERVRAAIERAAAADGVLVLMDLGSALMSAEMAVELLGETAGPVALSAGPLVEGAVAAAVAAAGGASLAEVAAQAREALEMKRGQVVETLGGADVTGGAGGTEGAGGTGGMSGTGGADVTEGAGGAEGAGGSVRAELPVLNRIGLHARPAALFVRTSQGFDADVRVAKTGGGPPVRASSLTAIIGLGARLGDSLTVTASGPEATAALAALARLAEEGFGDGVEPGALARAAAANVPATRAPGPSAPAGEPGAQATEPAVPTTGPGISAEPRRRIAAQRPAPPSPGLTLTGVAVSGGVAVGPARQLRRAAWDQPPERPAGAPAAELALLERGLDAARAAIERDRDAIAARATPADAAIFEAHLALLDDEALLDPARSAIDAGATAERAWYLAAGEVAELYRALPDPLLAERAADVLDVGRRVIDALHPREPGTAGGGPAILLAVDLTPADAAAIDPEQTLGIALAHGSPTSHGAILARALGLPAVTGLGDTITEVVDGTQLLLDGEAATLRVRPSADAVERAGERQGRIAHRRALAAVHAGEPAITRDGVTIEVMANLGAAGQAAGAVASGADGVGLLRTEFLFAGRPRLPDEDEQVEVLREIAAAIGGRPLVVRTLDAGADKPLASLPMQPEDNPFLGVRGIRLQLAHPEVLATQLRAILRVAEKHPVRAMVPMVAAVSELLTVRAALDDARARTGIIAPLPLGIMVEVPSAALVARHLARHADFFSIGTNDLTQYTMAAGRGDVRLAPLLAGPQPAVLTLVRATVEAAAERGRTVAVCGELAGDPACAVLLAGLGVTELSMSPALIGETKAALRSISLSEARRAALRALDEDTPDGARAQALELL